MFCLYIEKSRRTNFRVSSTSNTGRSSIQGDFDGGGTKLVWGGEEGEEILW